MRAWQRHQLAMTARFRDAVVLTYAVPASLLEQFVPPALQLETTGGNGFLAVALVDMRGLRPSKLPPWTGTNAVFVGYRVFVRTRTGGGRHRRGLKVVRTDVDRPHVLFGTKVLTRYEAGLVSATWDRQGLDHHLVIRSRWRGADVHLHISRHVPATPPAGSPFRSWSEAAPYSSPLPWTFAPDDSGQTAIAVKGVRSRWQPQPVTVHSHALGFLSTDVFDGHQPALASAFHVSDVAYSWAAGIRQRINPPGQESP